MTVVINGREHNLSFTHVAKMAPIWTWLGFNWYFYAKSVR